MNQETKREIILEHYQHPKNKGLIDDEAYLKALRTPVSNEVQIKNNSLEAVGVFLKKIFENEYTSAVRNIEVNEPERIRETCILLAENAEKIIEEANKAGASSLKDIVDIIKNNFQGKFYFPDFVERFDRAQR